LQTNDIDYIKNKFIDPFVDGFIKEEISKEIDIDINLFFEVVHKPLDIVDEEQKEAPDNS
jgi:hypothetical protein